MITKIRIAQISGYTQVHMRPAPTSTVRPAPKPVSKPKVKR